MSVSGFLSQMGNTQTEKPEKGGVLNRRPAIKIKDFFYWSMSGKSALKKNRSPPADAGEERISTVG